MEEAEIATPRMNSKQPAGVVAVTVTPCRSPGEVDPPAMTRLCSILSKKGCQGLFVLGSTGEMPLLDEKDRRELTVAAREGASPETLLYAGISGTGLSQAIRYARFAAQDGADLVVAMVPFMFRYSQEELTQYILSLADASPIPVALYHHLRMPSHFDVETIGRVAWHPNVVAVKDTSVDMDRLRALLDVTAGTGMVVFQGAERLFYESLAAGAGGCVTALAGLAPEWHLELYEAHRNGDDATARRNQQAIDALWKMFTFDEVKDSFSYFGLTLKKGLQLRGWLERTDGMMVGFAPNGQFEKKLREHFEMLGWTHPTPAPSEHFGTPRTSGLPAETET